MVCRYRSLKGVAGSIYPYFGVYVGTLVILGPFGLVIAKAAKGTVTTIIVGSGC